MRCEQEPRRKNVFWPPNPAGGEEKLRKECAEEIPHIAHGVFGAHMEVSLVNDGPFTVVLDSSEILR